MGKDEESGLDVRWTADTLGSYIEDLSDEDGLPDSDVSLEVIALALIGIFKQLEIMNGEA